MFFFVEKKLGSSRLNKFVPYTEGGMPGILDNLLEVN